MLRVGVIGAGWIAGEHLAVLAGRDDVSVAAVCDLDRGRAERLAPAGARVYERWEDVLEHAGVDALWVCTPPLAHRGPTVAALSGGVHVYLEKPVARTREEAESIVAAAESSAAVCAVGYQWRAVEALDELRSALAGQEVSLLLGRSIGPTGSRPWFLDRGQGGGNILERGSHHIDLVRAVAGEVVAVQAAASGVLLAQRAGDRGDIEDAVTLVLRLAGGALATVVVAWTRDGQPGSYTLDVVATDATLALVLDPAFTLTGVSNGAAVAPGGGEQPFARSIGRFLEAVSDDDPSGVFCTPRDALGTLAVAEGCEEALAAGRTVSLA